MRFNPSVTEVARHFADYINRVAFRGERFTLMRGNKPVAELRPVPAGRRLGELPELLASLPRLSPADAAALADDLDAARQVMAEQPLRDPWAS
jgi:antitoxin (DNA-binding transcriptional repressor) of toxin-antitoxin stability system